MTADIALTLVILLGSLVLFITEVIRMDLVALLVLGILAVTGLATPTEALSGFGNPAVVTVWAMFILSEGLTRTGIASLLGQQVMRIAGRHEAALVVVIMLTSGGLSFFMNNIGVAALMLPVVIEISRRTELSPSRLLMPMAFGTLLGGLTTLFGTPANLLVSVALDQAGHVAFGLFDYMPVGAGAVVAGIIFIVIFGRWLLPSAAPATLSPQRSQRALRQRYGLQDRVFSLRLPLTCALAGMKLGDIHIEAAAGLKIIALERNGRIETLPSRRHDLQGGDKLLVQGRLDHFEDTKRWSELAVATGIAPQQDLPVDTMPLLEATIAPDSNLISTPVGEANLRSRFGVDILAIARGGNVRRKNLGRIALREGDRLLLQGTATAIADLRDSKDFQDVDEPGAEALQDIWDPVPGLFVMSVPAEPEFDGMPLVGSRTSDIFGFCVVGLVDGDSESDSNSDDGPGLPDGEPVLHGGERLFIRGHENELDILRGLCELVVEESISPNLNVFDADRIATVEATLAPRSELVGQSVADINFRERFGLELGGIWRAGSVLLDDLDRQTIEFGDAFVLLGPRQKLVLLNTESDLLVLTPISPDVTDTSRAPIAAGIMLGVVASVLSGWMPISIAAIAGVTLMVVTGCLSMEQAYRAIDWRAVVLIAGMLPLGIAMQESGAAQYLASLAMDALGDSGPWTVIFGLYIVTAASTMIIPTVALVVLMSPIALSACAELGIAPQTAMMGIAMAASASFTSPISHPANVLIMGPGGYRFSDYIKLGGPLTIIVFIVVMLLLPIFWPLQPA